MKRLITTVMILSTVLSHAGEEGVETQVQYRANDRAVCIDELNESITSMRNYEATWRDAYVSADMRVIGIPGVRQIGVLLVTPFIYVDELLDDQEDGITHYTELIELLDTSDYEYGIDRVLSRYCELELEE